VWKALELDRRKCGLGHEKGQTAKRENKREWSHGPFLLLNLPGADTPCCKSKPGATAVSSAFCKGFCARQLQAVDFV
jgi:hypothetical protein